MGTQSVHANFQKNSLLGTQKSAGGIQAVGELNSPFQINQPVAFKIQIVQLIRMY